MAPVGASSLGGGGASSSSRPSRAAISQVRLTAVKMFKEYHQVWYKSPDTTRIPAQSDPGGALTLPNLESFLAVVDTSGCRSDSISVKSHQRVIP